MKHLTFLAIVAALAACHHTREEAGPAPTASDSAAAARDSAAAAVRDTSAAAARDTATVRDSAVTHEVDPRRTGPPGEAGRPPNATVNVDSVGVDTSKVPVDTSAAGAPPSPAAPQDTLGPRSTDSTAADTSSAPR